MKQLSLFDLLTPEPPKAEALKEFIIWYANMSGKGEHIFANFAGGERGGDQGFAKRNDIISGVAEVILYTAQEALESSDKHHARIGKMVKSKDGYEIEEIWK